MVKPAPVVTPPVITPTTDPGGKTKDSKTCTQLEDCVCGTLLGCAIKADWDVALFFNLLGKYPVAIFLWFNFTEFS